VVLTVVYFGALDGRADWPVRNGNNPVDAAQDVAFQNMAPYQAMPTVRMPGSAGGPDDLVYVLRAGLNTIAGRITGRADASAAGALTGGLLRRIGTPAAAAG
jgi:hypothetical protein